MFSTFTGNSRRPRNVNLSGSVGNPFTNTSWSPSAVSSADKTVSNAQAEREKRQAERLKVKSAVKIQRVWRGHRSRAAFTESQRAAFDKLYASDPAGGPAERLPRAFTLLLAVFSPRRDDDIQRAIRYARDTESVHLEGIVPDGTHSARLERLVQLLVDALDRPVSAGELSDDTQLLGKLAIRIIANSPNLVLPSVDRYYTVIAKICQAQELPGQWSDIVLQALSAPLGVDESGVLRVYHAYAFSFLANSNLHFFEANIDVLSKPISLSNLSRAIVDGQSSASSARISEDALLWQLAHFIDLSRSSTANTTGSAILQTLYTQLASLSPAISVRLSTKSPSEGSGDDDDSEEHLALDPYIATKLTSLVESNGIAQTLRDFSVNLAGSSHHEFQGVSLLAGYILTLLRCFPTTSDEIRMRLFLEEIPTSTGDVPIVKFMWRIMKETLVFKKLVTGAEPPVDVLRRYLGVTSTPSTSSTSAEEQDWRVVLLFLELYIFMLRLSDDEDFFSGIYPQLIQSNSPKSRARAGSLSLEDVKALTSFLKNTAFTLHYKAQELSKSAEALEAAAQARMSMYLGASNYLPVQNVPAPSSLKGPAKFGLDDLRSIVTVAIKMLYERDSRKQFLPTDHWLMTDKLDKEDFISAVIAEEKRQNEEDSENGEDKDSELDFGAWSTYAGQELSRRMRLERLKAQQTRATKERRMAEMGPKLEILKHMPFVVPFETRVMIFRQFIQLDRGRRHSNRISPFNPFNKHHAQIRRKRLFEDAYKYFYELGESFKDPIQITFVDQFGAPEAGIDGGGVTKEFLINVTAEAFGSHEEGAGMFASNERGLLYPDPTSMDVLRESLRKSGLSEEDEEFRDFVSSQLRRFEFLGRIVGKCMYEGILVDLAFAGFFLLKWASTGPNDENNYKGSVNDLRDMDEHLYNGMLGLKNYSGDMSDLGLDFTIEDQVSQPGQPIKTITKKLIANGDQVQVTNDNRLLYISYVARHRLVFQPAMQTAAFLRGLRAMVRPSWLSMFNQSELQRLVGGDSSEIDVDDLRRNTVYSGLYEIGDDGQEHDTIKLFWKVMREFTDSQRRSVIKYVSSTPRAPLLGFSQLNPKFSIRDGGTDEDRLPSTSTCVNLLKLPRYQSEEVLREKLLYAVTSGAGFDLS